MTLNEILDTIINRNLATISEISRDGDAIALTAAQRDALKNELIEIIADVMVDFLADNNI